MTQIASLPVLTVALGVGRSDWRDPTGQTLIDISSYVRTHRTTTGKMHELDRYETGTLTMELDNRLGAFTPFDTTPKTYPIVGGGTTSAYSPSDLSEPMTYLQITATWSGTTYNVFQGYVSTWTLITPDEVNSDVMVQAEDSMKILSTTRVENPTLYPTTITDQMRSLVVRWQLVRCGDAKANIAGGLASYASNLWTIGNPSVLGDVNVGQPGAHVYDPSTAIDLSNGTQVGAGIIVWPDLNVTNTSPSDYYIEAWIKGAKTGDFLISNYRPNNYQITGIGVDSTGRIRLQRRTLTGGTPTDATLDAPHTGPDVTDGAWHLVGLQCLGGTISMFCDGAPVDSGYSDSTQRLRIPSVGAWINGTTTLPVGTFSTTATVGDIFIMRDYGLGIFDMTPYVHDRYRVGALMQTESYSVRVVGVTTSGGSATFDAAGFAEGQTVSISGVTPTGYNGSYVITSATASTFTVTNATTGSISVPGIASLASPKTTGYAALEVLEASGVIPAVPAPGLSSSSAVNYSIDVGTASIGVDTTSAINKTPAEVCLTASDTELGAFVWEHSNARFEFHDRFWWARNQVAGISATLSDQAGTVARYLGDVEIVKDDLDVWTKAGISDITSANYTVTSANVNKYGPRTITRSTYADGKITAEALGNTILYRHQQPSLRVSRVDLASVTGSTNMSTMLALGLGDIVLFERRDASALIYSEQLAVESISHDFNAEPGRWATTYVLSPFEIYGGPYLTFDGTAPNVLSGNFTLSSALVAGNTYTSISVNATESAIHSGARLTLSSGTHSQAVQLALYTPAAGSLSLTMSSFVANYSYPVGTALTGVSLPVGG